MKTIIRNENGASIYLFDDATVVDIQTDKVIVGDPPEFIISDCNQSNVTVVDVENSISDWVGHKYLLIDGVWEPNPEYVAPAEDERGA